jgi:hypothetical protein
MRAEVSQVTIGRLNRVVAKPRKDAVTLIGKIEAAGSMELIQEIESVGMIAGPSRFDESLKEELDIRGSDVEFGAEMMIVCKPLAHSV